MVHTPTSSFCLYNTEMDKLGALAPQLSDWLAIAGLVVASNTCLKVTIARQADISITLAPADVIHSAT
jgi:hypothetical protein